MCEIYENVPGIDSIESIKSNLLSLDRKIAKAEAIDDQDAVKKYKYQKRATSAGLARISENCNLI